MHDLAERVYRLTQPYLYGVWLLKHERTKEALPVYVALATGGPAEERGWGYLGWSNTLQVLEGETSRLAMLQRGVEADPHLFIIRQNITLSEDEMSRPEKAIVEGKKALAILATPGNGGIRGDVAPYSRNRVRSAMDAASGDYHAAAMLLANNFKIGSGIFTYSVAGLVARSFAGEHDLKRARVVAVMNWNDTGFNLSIKGVDDLSAQMFIATQAGDWGRVIALDTKTAALLAAQPTLRDLVLARIVPFVAMAHARLGDLKAANALIAETPDHCDLCLRTRAQIAELEQQYGRMDWWFARAVAENPSIPFAYTDWGQTLMANGDLASAIAKFESAHAKGPRFADPLEMWGEALIAQNRSDLALAKFEEANRYAPNWGRLHLKWGVALWWLGKKDEAKKQFALAATLELTPPEKAERARFS
jgi:hypothetical protein